MKANNLRKKGALVFIPSDVRLIQFDKNSEGLDAFVNKHMTTNKPKRALLIEDIKNFRGQDYCKIFYDGDYWFATGNDVYDGDASDY